MVSGGCDISGATVRRSVLFSNVKVNSYATLEDAVVLPDTVIGRHAKLRKVVIDKGCFIPEGLEVGFDRERDAKSFYVSPAGVTLITPEMLGQHVHYVR
jgi:glucose-1-phosphate adenylyltransferase